jgi:hypothetical protein
VRSGIFVDVERNEVAPAELQSVRCLECGAIYEKPTGGGTVRQNPGCPECGYLGWARADGSVTELQPRRFAADRLRRPPG